MTTNKTRLLLVGLVCLALWPIASRGQSPELRTAHERTSDLYAQGRYRDALPFAEEALRLGEQEFGPTDPTTATLLNNLALIYHAQGRYAEAEPLHKRALGIRERALGPRQPEVATSLEHYAALLRETGRSREATKMEARAEAIRAKHAEQ